MTQQADAVTVSAVIVAYGEDPWLEQCVRAVLSSNGVTTDVVLVDNGDTGGAVRRLTGALGVSVIVPGTNTGFAEGANIGARAATGDVLAFINPDVLVDRDALRHLAEAALEQGVGIATSSLRLAQAPALMNSAGNPVHYLGLAWAGGHGEPASAHMDRLGVASASGACCALRRTVWRELGGFEPAYFAYHEDVELSLRCWLRGDQVVYIPGAVALHHYDFSRNDAKMMLLERNRLLTILTIYSRRTLLLLAPALVATELLILAAAAVDGSFPSKVAGYRWLITHRRSVAARRRQVQGDRRLPDKALAHLLTGRFEPGNVNTPRAVAVFNVVSEAYWRIVRTLL